MSAALELPALFFLVALIYSMVGFGGGSSYVALLALFGVSYSLIPVIGLTCNLIASSSGSWNFYRAGHFRLKLTLPFILTSVPAAYIGGALPVSRGVFLSLLAAGLTVAGALLLKNDQKTGSVQNTELPKNIWIWGLPIGMALGLFSGIVGIGGGIFLAPLLHLLRWGNAQSIAATAAMFIFINSLFGLMGQLSKSAVYTDAGNLLGFLIPAVLVGSMIGSRLGARQLSTTGIRKITGLLILYVAFRLWIESIG